MSPGQETSPDIGCFVVEQAGGRVIALPPQQIPLDTDCFVIGRESDCHLAIPNQAVSRRHAQLLLRDGQWAIEDLGTRNGTWVNGRRVRGRTPLSHGDEIRVPDFLAVFEDA